MEHICLDRAVRAESIGHSSKGNQLKWKSGDSWYKADYMGYEGLSEVVVSRLLGKTDVGEFVPYTPVMIEYDGRLFHGCKSSNFLQPDEELITVDRLFRQFTGKNLTAELARIRDMKERILYLTENVAEITGLKEFGAYMTAALEIDAVFLNEDRHTNNIAVIYQENTGSYRLCPYFDHGLSLYADITVDFPIDQDLEACKRKIEAKPFSRDFDEQMDAAEELYGKQVHFRFDEQDIREAVAALDGIYDARFLQRAEQVLNQQRRKYGYLFSDFSK